MGWVQSNLIDLSNCLVFICTHNHVWFVCMMTMMMTMAVEFPLSWREVQGLQGHTQKVTEQSVQYSVNVNLVTGCCKTGVL